ncbi:hypothetical protein P691DRAFT_343001 [Macrolepiota fuliginosa MF-IS2]|uniref:G domain-containing protein n=1 Tax=Macrolepiota fuliginosa MF-IS2 TaxID=1400762 RepID=A0A9P5X4I6_9AGAR|nr:hypothetical protein P691DRAFT_343001 [Macrolepiota fuliginosa MF-IS2]
MAKQTGDPHNPLVQPSTDQPLSQGDSSSCQAADGTQNIILFGETGVGKSSLINMLSDSDVAIVSNGATGCTFENVRYNIKINGVERVLWDTAGLSEGEAGSVPEDQALRNLRDLVWKLREGVSLLVYCIGGTRYRDILKVNFDLFTDIICQGTVPVVVVVTGLENEERMDNWWDDNKANLSRHRMDFQDYACITTTRGRKNKQGVHLFQEEYEMSKGAAKRLISKNCPQHPVRIADSDSQWVERITERMEQYCDAYNSRSREEKSTGYHRLLMPLIKPSLLALQVLRGAWSRVKNVAGTTNAPYGGTIQYDQRGIQNGQTH